MLFSEIVSQELQSLEEVAVRRKRVVRHARVIRKRTCAPGFRLVNGRCVRQSARERLNRKRGAIRGDRKSKAQRIRSRRRSLRVRRRSHL